MLTLATRSLAVLARIKASFRPTSDKTVVDIPKLDLDSYIQNYRGEHQVICVPPPPPSFYPSD